LVLPVHRSRARVRIHCEDDPGDHDHRAEDPARDVVRVQLVEHVYLGYALLPAEALLEAREREHAEEGCDGTQRFERFATEKGMPEIG